LSACAACWPTILPPRRAPLNCCASPHRNENLGGHSRSE
jgi:hypothetical protein